MLEEQRSYEKLRFYNEENKKDLTIVKVQITKTNFRKGTVTIKQLDRDFEGAVAVGFLINNVVNGVWCITNVSKLKNWGSIVYYV